MSPATRRRTKAAPPAEPAGEAVVRVALDDEVTIASAEQTKATLLGALAGARRLVLDLSSVAELDTAGLQVLLLVAREAAAAGRVVEVDGMSAPVAEVLSLARIGTGLGVTASPAPRDAGEDEA